MVSPSDTDVPWKPCEVSVEEVDARMTSLEGDIKNLKPNLGAIEARRVWESRSDGVKI